MNEKGSTLENVRFFDKYFQVGRNPYAFAAISEHSPGDPGETVITRGGEQKKLQLDYPEFVKAYNEWSERKLAAGENLEEDTIVAPGGVWVLQPGSSAWYRFVGVSEHRAGGPGETVMVFRDGSELLVQADYDEFTSAYDLWDAEQTP